MNGKHDHLLGDPVAWIEAIKASMIQHFLHDKLVFEDFEKEGENKNETRIDHINFRSSDKEN